MNDQSPDQRIGNLIRIGTIAEVQLKPARVRVACGGLTSGWLQWLELRGGTTTTWNPPTVGEACLWLSPSGETESGKVIVFAADNAQISADKNKHITKYPDGATLIYDHAEGALSANGIKTALIDASTKTTLKTPETHITGNVTIDGNLLVKGTGTIQGLLTYLAGMSGQGGAGGGTEISGTFAHTGDFSNTGTLSSNGVVLHLHIHGGVIAGGASTGAPK